MENNLENLSIKEKSEKKWYEAIDFYKLTGIVFLWVSSWLFMIPHYVDVNTPFFDNVWGAFFAFFGAYKQETSVSQQLPDLMSGLIALSLMIILQLRGIFSVTSENSADSSEENSDSENKHRVLITVLNILSIIVHSLFFSMMIKIFLFPETGETATIYERMRLNLGITIFTSCAITGMVFGVPSLSKFFLVLLFAVGVFKNISVVSNIMGVAGFVAVLLSILGFYLEFCAGSFDKNKLLLDLAILSGRYNAILKEAESEGEQISSSLKKKSLKINPKKSLLKKAEKLK